MFKKIISTLFLAVFAAATAASSAPVVYEDVLNNNDWVAEQWFGTLKNVTSLPGHVAFTGKWSARANITQPYGGVTFLPVGGQFDASAFTNLTFAVRKSSSARAGLVFYAMDGGGVGSILNVSRYIDTGGLPTGKWKWVSIPVSALGLTGPIVSMSFETDAPVVLDYDHVIFDKNLTIYRGIRGQGGPSNTVTSWGGTITPFFREAAHPGNSVVNAVFGQAFGGVGFTFKTPVMSSDYRVLTLMVKVAEAGQNLHAYFTDEVGKVTHTVRLAHYLPSGDHTLDVWEKVSIPMRAFVGKKPRGLGSFFIENALPGTVMFDTIILK